MIRQSVLFGKSGELGVTFMGKNFIVSVGEFEDEDYILVEKIKKTKVTTSVISAIFSLMLFGIYVYIYFKFQNILGTLDVKFQFYVIFNVVIFLMFWIMGIRYASKWSERKKRYHAAEHMYYNALMKKGEISNTNDVRKFGRFSKDCGVKVYTNFIFMNNILLIFCYFCNIAFPMLLIFIIANLLPGINPYAIIFQLFFSTQIPNDKELKVARKAMMRLVELENFSDYIHYEEMLCDEQIDKLHDLICLIEDEKNEYLTVELSKIEKRKRLENAIIKDIGKLPL